jgi:hypothetical protein
VIGEVGAERGQVAGAAAGLVEDLEHAAQGVAELASEPARGAVTLGQRGEVAQHVREAQLPLGVVDKQVDGIARVPQLIGDSMAAIWQNPCVYRVF